VSTFRLINMLPFAVCVCMIFACTIEDEQSDLKASMHDTRTVQVPDSTETADALEALREMSEFLAGRPQLSFEAEVDFDVVQSDGHKLEFGSSRSLTLRRPDHAFLAVKNRDGSEQFLYFDGNTLSIVVPSRKTYARREIGGSVDAALDHLVKDLGIPTPLGDLIHPDLYSELAPMIESASWVGEEMIGEVACDHLVFRTPDVDFQIWIEQGDRVLPRRMVITYRSHEGQPQFRARLMNWDIAAETPDQLFSFDPPDGYTAVSFPQLFESLDSAAIGE